MSNPDQLISVLTIVAVFLIILIFTLIGVWFFIVAKQKKNDGEKSEKNEATPSPNATYNLQSIMDFMEFEKVEDNMIIQKKGKYPTINPTNAHATVHKNDFLVNIINILPSPFVFLGMVYVYLAIYFPLFRYKLFIPFYYNIKEKKKLHFMIKNIIKCSFFYSKYSLFLIISLQYLLQQILLLHQLLMV